MNTWRRSGSAWLQLLLVAVSLGCSNNAGGQMSKTFFDHGAAAQLEAAIRADDVARVAAALAALLARGADPNLVAEDGAGAVSLAVDNYRSAPAILQAVIKAGGNPNARRADGDPVLMRFVNDRHCEAIRWMKFTDLPLQAQGLGAAEPARHEPATPDGGLKAQPPPATASGTASARKSTTRRTSGLLRISRCTSPWTAKPRSMLSSVAEPTRPPSEGRPMTERSVSMLGANGRCGLS